MLDEECDTQYLDVAPGEGNYPKNIYFDKYAEELAFPCIYAGHKMKDIYPVNIKLSERLRWELRNYDRRVAENSEKIFFMYKKYQANFIHTKQSFAIRLLKNKNYRNCDVNDLENLKKISGVNDGFFFFKNFCNSPMYLNSRKKDLIAAIRQLGRPTWFISLSSADTRWPGLLKCLSKVLKNTELNDEDIENMSFQDRCKLLNADPVTAARYFDSRMNYFLHKFIYNDTNPIGKVVDHFYKIEFQHRGSPHVHMLVFTEDSPKYRSPVDINDIAKYVDKYVSCSLEVDSEMKDLIKIQTHKHSRTCRKRGKAICRFNFPLPPMRKTSVLTTLAEPTALDRQRMVKISEFLNSYQDLDNMSHDAMLEHLQMTDAEYIRAICSSLSETKLFLKRKPNECRVNAYMINLIKVWQGNHDIQFCLNVYSCISYIVSYIQKTNRGLSLALSKVKDEFKNDPQGVRDQVKVIGNIFLNGTEISIQECVYMLLGLPMCYMSRDVAYINTAPKHERIKVLRSKEYLEHANPNSTDICFASLYDKYSKRPKQFEAWCLADFATRLRIVYTNTDTLQDDDETDENGPIDPEEMNNNEETLLNCRNFVYKMRKKPKILKYHVPAGTNRTEILNRIYLFMFYPWRDEDNFTTIHDTYTDFVNSLDPEHKKIYFDKMAEYNQESPVSLENLDREISEDNLPDGIAPSTEYLEQRDREYGSITLSGEDFFIAEPQSIRSSHEAGNGEGINTVNTLPENVDNLWPQTKVLETVNSLNFKQRCIYDHVMKHIIQSENNLHLFITGGAGVGKSVVLRLLHASMSRFYNLDKDGDTNIETVKCVAFTGKAAFLIHGETLHNSLGIQPNRSYSKYITLNADKLNTIRMKWQHVKALLIDEISLVGSTFFSFINRRLQDIFGTRKVFGGLHIITFGDFFQLPPVCDGMIFMPPKGDIARFGTNLWQDNFLYYELTQIMRQQNDLAFAQALNRIRKGIVEQADVAMIKSREIVLDLTEKHLPQILCAVNSMADRYNQQLFDDCTQDKCTVIAKDKVLGNTLDKNIENVLLKISADPQKTACLSTTLNIAVGLIYDVIINVDVKDGLANGTTGEIKRIEYQPGCNKPFLIWFDFKDINIGKNQRQIYAQYYNDNTEPHWTPIVPIARKFNVGTSYTEISRTQFPIKQSSAKTIHKSQGCTVDSIAVHISGSFRPYMRHMMYVALSRVTSLNGLHVINFNSNYIRVSDSVLEDNEEALDKRACTLNYTLLPIDSNTHNIYYENVQSLKLHLECLKKHLAIQNAHLIMVVETRLTNSDVTSDVTIPDYEILRVDEQCSGTAQPSGGIIIYVHKTVTLERHVYYQAGGVEMIQLFSKFKGRQERHALLYRHPRSPRSALLDALKTLYLRFPSSSLPFTIIGDFNVDTLLPENTAFIKKIENITNLKLQPCSPTTKIGAHLYLVFSNTVTQCCTHFLPWSYHFGISCYKPEDY